MKRITVAAVFIAMFLLANTAYSITIGISPQDENYKKLSDQLNTDLCTYVYNCFHTKSGSMIRPVTGNISGLYISETGKAGGITPSAFNSANLKAQEVDTATEADHALTADTSVWSDTSSRVQTNNIYTARNVATADVSNSEVTGKTYWVDYAYSATYANVIKQRVRVLGTLRSFNLFYDTANKVYSVSYTNNAKTMLSTSTPIQYSKTADKLEINDNVTNY